MYSNLKKIEDFDMDQEEFVALYNSLREKKQGRELGLLEQIYKKLNTEDLRSKFISDHKSTVTHLFSDAKGTLVEGDMSLFVKDSKLQHEQKIKNNKEISE